MLQYMAISVGDKCIFYEYTDGQESQQTQLNEWC